MSLAMVLLVGLNVYMFAEYRNPLNAAAAAVCGLVAIMAFISETS